MSDESDVSTEMVADQLGARVLVIYPPEGEARLVNGAGSMTIGRADSNDIAHPSVSRRHATIHFGAVVTLEDAGGKNGTMVAGRRLGPKEQVVLRNGVAVEVGETVLMLRDGNEPIASMRSPPRGDGAETPMQRVDRLVRLVADSGISVILQGETGAGKDVYAERIHTMSRRADKPFVAINCAAIAENLIESELFGYEKGAFTGATAPKVGLLEAAHQGTVFFDEIGELPLAMQAKLLRALERREVVPVGGVRPRPFDARFISATHRDLEALVADEEFRADLFFRLNGIMIEIPPLRERLDEIPELAIKFLALSATRDGAPNATPPALEESALSRLRAHDFPGNIRELKNILDRAYLLSGGRTIRAEHIDIRVPKARPQGTSVAPSAPVADTGALEDSLAALERSRIKDALTKAAGNQTRAAELLGISRKVLIHRLTQYGINRPRRK